MNNAEIQELCGNGRVCEAIGHKWVFLRLVPNTPNMALDETRRKCQICGIRQFETHPVPVWVEDAPVDDTQ